jgi:hypothetical protein
MFNKANEKNLSRKRHDYEIGKPFAENFAYSFINMENLALIAVAR